MMDYVEELNRRIAEPEKGSLLDVKTSLQHFLMISYAIPTQRLTDIIPPGFSPWRYHKNGEEYSLISAVCFFNTHFTFYKLVPFLKLNFFQVNYRTYIGTENNQKPAAWFFGTQLGSLSYLIPRNLWGMPWSGTHAKLVTNWGNEECESYQLQTQSKAGQVQIELTQPSEELTLLEGFDSKEQQQLILNHPIKGYFKSRSGNIKEYSVWHSVIPLRKYTAKLVKVEFYRQIGLLNEEEEAKPHSILATHQTDYIVHLPPRRWKL